VIPQLPARDKPLDLGWVQEIAEDNPRAVVVCVKVGRVAHLIDPDADFGADGWLLHFKTLGIKGARIATLHDVVCEGNVVLMIALLRAVQMGHMRERELRHLIDDGKAMDTYPACRILEAVRRDLPRFTREATAQ
jgi:hypothetical protein